MPTARGAGNMILIDFQGTNLFKILGFLARVDVFAWLAEIGHPQLTKKHLTRHRPRRYHPYKEKAS